MAAVELVRTSSAAFQRKCYPCKNKNCINKCMAFLAAQEVFSITLLLFHRGLI